ncbi:putative ferric reductase transmembrane component [Thozetella sp. PMI_491]|nr:putative ferric reductase transmembrane component [Thozetella sp. PMI_491]
MNMGGTPWLDQPVMLHSSRADKCTLTAEQCAYRSGYWRYWYEADHVFGLSTIYFFIVTIGICLVGFWSLKLAPASLRQQSWFRKAVSFFRFLAYRRFKALGWETPSAGVLFLLVTGFIFFMAMTLGPQPYYWPNTRTLSFGNSPPIATRTGYMALACLPFLIILATKANMIASLTGVSHDRLMVFHTWVAWAMLVLALVHTFPFIVFHTWKGDMVTLWNTSVVYWTGVAALIPQAYLTFMSLPRIRNKYYEFFKATHYIAAILFVVFFFIHCDFRLTSWDYFIATGVLYTVSFLYSQIRTYFEHGISQRATVVRVSQNTLKVTVPVKNMTWQPGQHVFLRFLAFGLHAFTAHPFTICSSATMKSSDKSGERALVFYVRPRWGVTCRLAAAVARQPGGLTVPVLIEGPYGGLQTRPLNSYDRALVIGCGIGAGFSLPFVMEWALMKSRVPSDNGGKLASRLQVIIATRDAELIEWYEAALVEFLEDHGLPFTIDDVEILVYFTTSNEVTPTPSQHDATIAGDEKSLSALPKVTRIPIKVLSGRPDITTVVREATLEAGVSVGIAACGPAGVLKAAQDEAATAQLKILSSGTGAKEVYLHSEVFSW